MAAASGDATPLSALAVSELNSGSVCGLTDWSDHATKTLLTACGVYQLSALGMTFYALYEIASGGGSFQIFTDFSRPTSVAGGDVFTKQ